MRLEKLVCAKLFLSKWFWKSFLQVFKMIFTVSFFWFKSRGFVATLGLIPESQCRYSVRCVFDSRTDCQHTVLATVLAQRRELTHACQATREIWWANSITLGEIDIFATRHIRDWNVHFRGIFSGSLKTPPFWVWTTLALESPKFVLDGFLGNLPRQIVVQRLLDRLKSINWTFRFYLIAWTVLQVCNFARFTEFTKICWKVTQA